MFLELVICWLSLELGLRVVGLVGFCPDANVFRIFCVYSIFLIPFEFVGVGLGLSTMQVTKVKFFRHVENVNETLILILMQSGKVMVNEIQCGVKEMICCFVVKECGRLSVHVE